MGGIISAACAALTVLAAGAFIVHIGKLIDAEALGVENYRG
jgi:hypothetical protein